MAAKMAVINLEFDLHYYNINQKCIKVYIFREDLTRRITWWIYVKKYLGLFKMATNMAAKIAAK